MGSDQDWRELIDGSFGDGPGRRPVADRLVAGRRALRRRRIATGLVAAVVAVGFGGVAWQAFPSEPRTGGEIASTPDETPDRNAKQNAAERDIVSSVPHSNLVRWTGSGWKVATGWAVVDRVDNPMGYQLPRHSVGLELKNGPDRVFVLATDEGDGVASLTQLPVPPGTTLREWLPAQIDNLHGPDEDPAAKPVRFGDGESLVPAEGVTIIDQVPHPDLPANFAAATDRTAAAWIEANGKERFVLVRELGGREEIIPFTGSFPNLKKFLRYAEQQYEGGAGLR